MIPVSEPEIGIEELAKVKDAVQSGWVSSKGDYINQFEQNFADFCGRRFGLSTSNGTAALHLAIKSLGIGKDDEVIVPNLTFIAVANAVNYCGAKPIFIDSHRSYWNIDPAKIEEKITDKTKAIVAVHSYGHPCDMEPILKIARDRGLFVVEDGAEAHGARYKGKVVGSFGDVSAFSFYGNKIVTTGEGGMCLTNDKEIFERMSTLRDHGMSKNKKYWHDTVGFNYRMTNLQAAIGTAQLAKIDEFIRRRRTVLSQYTRYMRPLFENGLIEFRIDMPWADPVCWMFSILVDKQNPTERDRLISILRLRGIDSRPLFYPIAEMPPYKNAGKYPISEDLSQRGISLPTSVKLTEEKIERIVDVVSMVLHK